MRELFEALQRHAGTSGEKIAFDDGTTRLAYATLAKRVAGAAEELRAAAVPPAAVGLLGGNRTGWVVAQLALWHEGRTVVPLPPFFSPTQLGHIIRDAGICFILATAETAETARGLGVPFAIVSEREADVAAAPQQGGGVITYTSGSTGRPKGVLLGSGQVLWSARALADAIGAVADDRYLSVLPLALLLETICALVVPILVGARARLEPEAATGFSEATGDMLARVVEANRPSCMVLVPQLLARWAARLRDSGRTAPDSLRFVAVGGAPTSPGLAAAAWRVGIPAHEGYGLSECGSVVSLNVPGERRAGTVGRPLAGLGVQIDDGEIIVRGPPVMDRYLHGAPAGGVWRTGDIGEIDANGYLRFRGRKDNRLVTPSGRNISPEWIEALLAGDPRIAYCMVAQGDDADLSAVLIPDAASEDWFARASAAELEELVAGCCPDVPAYAVPRRVVVLSAPDPVAAGLVTDNGRVRRAAMSEAWAAALASGGSCTTVPRQRIGER